MEYKELVKNIYKLESYSGYIYTPSDKDIVLIDIPENIEIIDWMLILEKQFDIKNIKYIILQYNQNNYIPLVLNLRLKQIEPTIICSENLGYYNYNHINISTKWIFIEKQDKLIELSDGTSFYVKPNPLILGEFHLITELPNENILFTGLLFSSISNKSYFEDTEISWYEVINFTNKFLPCFSYENDDKNLFLEKIKTIIPSLGSLINITGSLFLEKFIQNEKLLLENNKIDTKDKILNKIENFIDCDKFNKLKSLSKVELMSWIEEEDNSYLNLLIKPISRKILKINESASVTKLEVLDLKHKLIETTIDQITNPVTELFNVNFFNKSMIDELQKRIESKKNGSWLYIQLNEKDHINNTYDIDTNNRILFNLARGFESFIEDSSDRIKHQIFHLENDVFCYYIPDGSIDYFLFIAEKLQLMVKNRTFFTEDLTISIGIVTFTEGLSLEKDIKSIFNYLNERAIFRLKYALVKDLNHINFEVLQENFDNLDLKQSKIVIISSDSTFLDVLSFNLKANGFEVIELSDGLAAYDYIEKRLPDLIISDSYIPKLDGLSLKERLNEKLRLRRIPYIITTSNKTDELITRAHSLNIMHILKDPISFKEIVGLSNILLEGLYGDIND